MTADIRTAAQARAETIWRSHQCRPDGNECVECVFRQGAFIDGAEWAVARVTPTREHLIELLSKHQHDYCAECHMSYGCTCDWKHPAGSLDTDDDNPTKSISSHQADAILALMQGLAEGATSPS